MKCPNCQHNQTYRSGGMQCSKCRYKYTFNPKSGKTAGLTDGKFLGFIKKASQNGTYFFTLNQLYATYVRSKKNSIIARLVITVIVFVIVGFILGWTRNAFFVAIPAALLAFFATLPLSRAKSFETFESWVFAWRKDGKKITGLITEPTLHLPPNDWPEDDLFDYGVERILVVQHDLLVDLFVLNHLHAEQRMLVVSENGYPQYLRPRVQKLLADSPKLPVFLFHDADHRGTGLAARVGNLPWLPIQERPVIDLGFFPQDLKKLKKLKNFSSSQRQSLPADSLPVTSLALGLSACFLTSSTFADELRREATNAASSESSFG